LACVAVDIAAVDLAVTEAVTNVVVHAYRHRAPADEPGRVRVGVAIESDAAWVVVADDGIGMAPRTDSPGLGMGLPVIAGVCDALEIEQRHDGTRIHMRFVVDADACGAETEGWGPLDDDTKRRIAINEATYRKINEGIRVEPADGQIAFLCECGRLRCNQLIELSRSAYEAVRQNPRRFAIVPGHDIAEAEDVVEQHEHYAVIQKRAEGAEVAERTDPRRPLSD
jgi:anti-sigma regulatory factor (Ser/Thr protein kinase)